MGSICRNDTAETGVAITVDGSPQLLSGGVSGIISTLIVKDPTEENDDADLYDEFLDETPVVVVSIELRLKTRSLSSSSDRGASEPLTGLTD